MRRIMACWLSCLRVPRHISSRWSFTMRNYTLACIIPFLLTLGAFGQKPEELIERLKDSEEETRAAAARALGSQKVEAAIPALAELLKDDDDSVQRAAGNALVRIGKASLPALTAALKDPKSRLAAA